MSRKTKNFVAMEIKEMRSAVAILEAYFKTCHRQHKTLNLGCGCYDPIAYYTQQVMSHAANLRTALENGGQPNAITLADGSILATTGGKHDNGGKRAKIPLKYLSAVQNNPDNTLTDEELKIRYLPFGGSC